MSIRIEQKIEKLISPIINELGYELENVEYQKEGDRNILKITIDNGSVVGIEDCEKVSRAIDDIIEENGNIKSEYVLEVSSPGIERIIKRDSHYIKYTGSLVLVKMYKQINGKKELQGILKGLKDDIVIVEVDTDTVEIPKANISQIKTIYNWEE